MIPCGDHGIVVESKHQACSWDPVRCTLGGSEAERADAA